MTNQRAISHLKDISLWGIVKVDEYNALKMAIKSLEQEPNYKSFCEFVAKTIIEEDFELNAGANAEIFCRKLAELGIVRADGDSWVLESEESE